ncbi:unnamed protein product [Vitrella brassicaformis CCMP3155]|uniref:Uncharacterized protein n=1 Tax=Vitrella brassicaformis (strain CCMP3155) TaxID=1169540 RepID=A0A0G4FRQ2_VITBC|nr:unnamed protein product [Vitrella brassicaformis CCMP3155]|eukprot:CEM16778.1 unnamed protein product [Vitrella brassicaformis CCMP3155]
MAGPPQVQQQQQQAATKKMCKPTKAEKEMGMLDFSKGAGESATKILVHAGTLMAAPHPCPKFIPPPVRELKRSDYNEKFAPKPVTSAGAKNKPLEKYNPNAMRNRLKTDEFVPPKPNRSQIVFGGNKDPRQFMTSNQNNYRGISGLQSMNKSIVAQKTRWYHHLQHL